MKTEKIRVTTEVKSNVEVGSILVKEFDVTHHYTLNPELTGLVEWF
jgi:hypothetical protein